MRKISRFLILGLVCLMAPVVEADTIHLKNGSILKGKVTSYADDQFIVMLDAGSGKFLSRALIYYGDVARIEFDSSGAVPGDSSALRDIPTEESPADAVRGEGNPSDPTVRETVSTGKEPRRKEGQENTDPLVTVPSELPTSTPSETEPARAEEAEAPIPSDTTESARRSSRRPTGPVRTANVDVVGKRDWTSTGLIVKRGDRIAITATGSVTLDPIAGTSSGPEGTEIADARKLMGDRPTGALIAVIGADNDDFIYVGRSVEFTAARDGLLFLSVNEGALSDNVGTYKAVVEVESSQGTRR